MPAARDHRPPVTGGLGGAHGAGRGEDGIVRKTIVATLVAVVAFATVALGVRTFGSSGETVETATVTRGTLEATIELSGSVAASELRDVGFATTGTVATVHVEVGDRVRAGDVLATLDAGLLEAQVAAAEAAVAAAEARLAADEGGLSDVEREAARHPITQAEAVLANARRTEQEVRAQNQRAVAAAVEGHDAAQAALDADVAAGADPIRIVADQAALAIASTALEAVSAQTSAAARSAAAGVASARSALAAAQHAYELRAQPVPAALLAADRAAVASAKASLAAALESLDLTRINSPIDGTVVSVGIAAGERVLPGAAVPGLGGSAAASFRGGIVVASLERLRVLTTASEIDIVHLAVGRDAIVTLDALPDAALRATVCAIVEVGATDQGVVGYPVELCLEDPRGGEGVRVGMSASASIVLARAEDALILPTIAIRSDGERHTVRRRDGDGAIREVAVVPGIASGTRTQILSGLSEGDRVVIPVNGTGG